MPPVRVESTSARRKQVSCARNWCFTLNNYTPEEYDRILTACRNVPFSKYIIGKETGEQGTPHLQGFVCTTLEHYKFRPLERLRFGNVALRDGKNAVHWEAAKGSIDENREYCSKDGDFVTNIPVRRDLDLISVLRPWQRELADIAASVPDKRTIHWIWEPKGGAGKTELCKYLTATYGAMLFNGKSSDILYMASMYESELYLADFTRDQQDWIPYTTLEVLKNGIYMSGKYEGERVLRNAPHIFVFANFPPKIAALSADRWAIAEIKNNTLDWQDIEGGIPQEGPRGVSSQFVQRD